jgi:hypothetical protein
MDHPLPWLRYVDAGDLESSTYKFDGLEVQSTSGDKLGKVDGFVVDSASGRPYYVAVDAGGWFKSRLFLLPIGHASFDSSRTRLVSDVSREHVDRFPGFDRDEFEKLSEDELLQMDEDTLSACCPSVVVDKARLAARFDLWEHYKAPNWWDGSFDRPDRVDSAAQSIGGTEAIREQSGRGSPAHAHDSKTSKTRG